MLDPDGSTTCPETLAVSSCAKAEFAASETSNETKQDLPRTQKRRSIDLQSSIDVCRAAATFSSIKELYGTDFKQGG
jgi:hypothetical protein